VHPNEPDLTEPLVEEQDDGSMDYKWLPNAEYVRLYGEAIDLDLERTVGHCDALQMQLDRQLRRPM